MKFKKRTVAVAATLLVALAIPVRLAAQEPNHEHSKYKLIDMGTFGGPNSFYFSEPVVQSVNNHGTVTGAADTSIPDPYAPNCDTPDCLILHAFAWNNGVLTDLGTLPGGFSSAAYWVNDRGLIMGGSENGVIDPVTGLPENIAVVWRGGEIANLGTLGGSFSFGNAMNNLGQVVGLALNAVPDPFSYLGLGTETHAFSWQGGAMQDLGTLGGPDSWASSVNERGQVAGWAYTNSTPNAATGVPTQDPFLWSEGKMRDLGTLGGTLGVVGALNNSGSGGALNDRGQVIGTSNLAGDLTHHAFMWERGVLRDLGTLGGPNSEAYWMNENGAVVGRADVPGDSGNHHAVMWKDGAMADLGVPEGQPCSTAYSINVKRQVLIDTGVCGVGGGPVCLWENGTLYDLQTLVPRASGITLTAVNFINDLGEIAALGLLPDGDQHALLLVPCQDGPGDAQCPAEQSGQAQPGNAAVSAATASKSARPFRRFGNAPAGRP
jgi:probable HAF family extracellular repeat protein